MHCISILLVALSLYQVDALRYGRLRQGQQMVRRDMLIDDSSTSRLTENVFFKDAGPIDDWVRPIEWVTLPLDHKNSSAGNFSNRYWVNDEFYRPGGPVFLLDVGEGRASKLQVLELINEQSYAVPLLRQFGGIGIIWEHRYYGDSTPTNITASTSAMDLKYLNTEQALADIPAFASIFKRNTISYDLTPAGTPWIFIGGSYPGMRAAFARRLYPDTIFASWASSAPVQASVDMSFYHEPIWQGLHNHGLGNCAADIHAAVIEFDGSLDNPRTGPALKDKLFGPGCGIPSNREMAFSMANIFDRWQYAGITPQLRDFCTWISTDLETNTTSGSNGWAATKGASFTIERWASWRSWDQNCTDTSSNIDTGDEKEKAEELADSIAWDWQTCTEWGFFQSANLGPHQLISKFNDLESWQKDCHANFPGGLENGLLPVWPRTNETNAKFGGWDIRPSNTFWTAGELDPWRSLSPLSDMPFSPMNHPDQNIPECGKSEAHLFGYLLKDAQHCYDLNEDFKGGDAARNLFAEALKKWLPCFSPANGGTQQRKTYLGPRRRS
jgi:hypothetical protein